MAPPSRRQKLTLRPYRSGDEVEILELHNREFSGHAERTLSHWRWKYSDNPCRRTEAVVAVTPEDRCVGVYAGIPHRALLDGHACEANLHADVCVDERYRAGLAGSRLLVRLIHRFNELYTGGEVKLGWGFPEPALHRVGVRFVRFQVLRDVVFLLRETGPSAEAENEAGVEARIVPGFGPEVDELWQRCRREVGTGIIRDRAYLQWRYAEHPDVPHVLFEARGADGQLRAVAAAREGGWDDSLYSIMDWLGRRDDVAAERALLRALDADAARRGRQWLAAWFAGAPPLFQRFQVQHGFFARWTPYQECFRCWSPGFTRRQLSEGWYQTMGDVDFF